jgi:hypothetical protein
LVRSYVSDVERTTTSFVDYPAWVVLDPMMLAVVVTHMYKTSELGVQPRQHG